ncbi:helix-turn-helix transcriptional regulator [Planosporangium sp. 12N6]|uniref:helix-turn-helix transcriptional regulator n=1 Tax=Planosporangium spinosum TaxID=3402278 RepID=UPI003CFA8AAA
MNPSRWHGEGEYITPLRRYRLAQRRKAVGLSQERLADVVGVDRSTVVRWERADTDPQPWHRPRLAAALKLSVEELAELLADVGESASRPNERLHYVLMHPTRVDLVSVAYLREQVERLDEQYEHVPSTLLLAEAGQLHGQAVFLWEHATAARVKRELTAAVTESATLMGQLVWDASHRRDHTVAASYFDQAITAARQIRNTVAEANAELRKSYLALYGTGNPAAGLARARRAAVTSQHDSHVIAGLALLHVGEAYAMLGEARSCGEALAAAETHFGRVRPDDPATALFCPSQHGRLVGSCWLSLGRPDKAELVLDATRQLPQSRRKATAIVLGNLALASIRQRDIDSATARLHEAIDVVEQTRGGGGLNIVFTAARELRPWRNEPTVLEVNDRLLTLMTAA